MARLLSRNVTCEPASISFRLCGLSAKLAGFGGCRNISFLGVRVASFFAWFVACQPNSLRFCASQCAQLAEVFGFAYKHLISFICM